MKATAKFRKVRLSIEGTSMYGHYIVRAFYKNKHVKAMTTDSECFDWLNDDSNKEKHLDAKRHAYNLIVREYELMKQS